MKLFFNNKHQSITKKIVPEDTINKPSLDDSKSDRDILGSTVAIMDNIHNNVSVFEETRRKNEDKIRHKINFLEQKIIKCDKSKRNAEESIRDLKKLLDKSQDSNGNSFICIIQ